MLYPTSSRIYTSAAISPAQLTEQQRAQKILLRMFPLTLISDSHNTKQELFCLHFKIKLPSAVHYVIFLLTQVDYLGGVQCATGYVGQKTWRKPTSTIDRYSWTLHFTTTVAFTHQQSHSYSKENSSNSEVSVTQFSKYVVRCNKKLKC